MRRGAVVWGALAVFAIGAAQQASAADIVVDTTTDGIDSAGNCSLREAVRAANLDVAVDGCTAGEADVVDTIFLSGVAYTVSVTGTGEDAALDGDLDITEDLAIFGAGPGQTSIGAAFNERVFHVQAGINLIISKLTISDGAAGANGGGAIRIENGGGLGVSDCRILDSQASEGGAIDGDHAAISLIRSWISGNQATGNGGGVRVVSGTLIVSDTAVLSNEGARGGGIYALDSVVHLTRSEVADNRANFEGGGLRIGGLSLLGLRNVTIAGNEAIGDGGGVLIAAATDALFANVTLAFNTADLNDPDGSHGGIGGGVFKSGSGTLTLRNTIIAGNVDEGSAPDCHASISTSQGHNLIQDPTECDVTPLASDLLAVDPLLQPLANNGGLSETLALGAASPARDAGDPAAPGSGGTACELLDQRSIERPIGSACDIGAAEADVLPTPTSTGGATPTATQPTPTPSDGLTPTVTPTSPTESATPTTAASPGSSTTPSVTATATSTLTPATSPTASATPTASPSTPTATATPGTSCSLAPAAGCRFPALATASTLAIVDATRDSNDGLTWTWAKGKITPKADFGDPLTTTGFDLCVYDGAATRIVQSHVEPGGLCGTQPCWKSTRHGFAYARKLGAPDGIDRITLVEGVLDGKAKIAVRAKGLRFRVPPLPIAPAVRVQLQSSAGLCWEASYATATKNDTRHFKARSN